MSVIDAVTWAELPFDSEDDLVALAGRCLEADGGLPLAADPAFLRRRWSGPGVVTLQGRTGEGLLVAAGAVRPTPAAAGAASATVGGAPATATAAAGTSPAAGTPASARSVGTSGVPAVGGATFVGLVDPEARGLGVGAYLLDWGLTEAARQPGPVTVETESLTAGAEALFAARGLRQVFAEDVMRVDFPPVPEGFWPVGVTPADWSDATAARFFGVYDAAFRERPGFPGLPAEAWIGDLVDDEEFRPGWSVLATDSRAGDVGFVTAAVDWIVQVGVVPSARGRGIGAALVAEALRRMHADGAGHAWLDVNVDNTAVKLYERLGFAHRGRRARFQPA